MKKAPSLFRFRRRSRFHRLVEHFEYNCIPAHMSSIHNFQLDGVLCVYDNLVVLHFTRRLTAQFGLLDIRRNKLLAVFGRQSFQKASTDQLSGQISPDRSLCLIRIPSRVWVRSHRNKIQVYDLLQTGALLTEVEVGDSPNVFCFDPRTRSQRLACSNFRAGQSNSLSIVDTESWEVIQTNNLVTERYPVLEPYLKEARYVHDGGLILLTVVDAFCHCRDTHTPRHRPVHVDIVILDGSTARTLTTIKYERFTCTLHACPSNYVPMVSRCGSRIAVTTNNHSRSTSVEVFRLPPYLRLQNACRKVIIQNCPIDKLVELPLPTKIINFLHFKDEFFSY